ncbi:MAG: serine/threonine protein kinase, partial [Kofleriaceae bacterium]|nr:serine/threonine protein kinase [Kofleriaceae bacterium]
MFEPGTVIGQKFWIERELGQGGMGVVVAATHLQLGQRVALKFLRPEATRDPAQVARFQREARAVARLRSEHVCRVLDVGSERGVPYIVMEHLEGRDLGTALEKGGPVPVAQAVDHVVQACLALAEAHAAGIVHRDLKPSNLFLTRRPEGTPLVKVMDFGIAKLHDSGDSKPALTQQGSVFGTPRYMSPEQVRGQTVDARSDLYALGLILYEMVCGRHPFEAVTTIDYLMKHVNEPVPVPSVEFQDLEISPRIEALVLKCLEKDPALRYQSAAELQRDVRLALRDFSEATRGYPTSGEGALPKAPATAARPSPATTGPKKGMPAWVWALLGLVLVGGIIGVVLAIGPSSKGGKDPVALTGDTP